MEIGGATLVFQWSRSGVYQKLFSLLNSLHFFTITLTKTKKEKPTIDVYRRMTTLCMYYSVRTVF